MMRALSAGVQGLRAHQVRMDVIGNNIANVNTTGFKASRVTFQDMYTETIGGATSPTAIRGGSNGKQIGLGVGVSSIDTIMNSGSLQLTGKVTDMAISGNGFFVMKDAGKFSYTRAGNFDFDAQGYLVNPATGARVQGWLPNNGTFPPLDVANITDIKLPVADSDLAKATTLIHFDQSLNANAPIAQVPAPPATTPPTHTTGLTVIDSLGKEHTLTMNLYKVNDNAWHVEVLNAAGVPQTLTDTGYGAVIAPAAGAPAFVAGQARLQFNSDGSLMDNDANPNTPVTVNLSFAPGGGASPMTVELDFTKAIQPAINGITTSNFRALDYDGFPTGTLDRITVDGNGIITGYYTNGQSRQVAQVALANFFNPAGLIKDNANNWVESPNSGHALIGAPGQSGRGTIASNNLEMSNVDISSEFTNMIVTQRGFQANSRIISASDEMLQDVVNLKR